MPRNRSKASTTLTTSQSLGSLLKSARDMMRKDKGLNGDLDRLPLLTWIMFLKFLDDLEIQREEEAVLARKKFKPVIEAPYRWRDWAANPEGITGDALLAFINQDITKRPDGTRGAGLFAYQEQFEEQIPGAIVRVEGLIRRLSEKRQELAEPEVAPRVAFEGRALNPAIGAAAQRLYLDGHYAQAVFEAGKTLIDLVKTKSGRADLDGVALMQTVFSVNDPILAFNARSDQSDKDEQQGMMHLYIGASMGVRNPVGHRVGVTEQPERALQYFELFSLLADRLDDAKKIK